MRVDGEYAPTEHGQIIDPIDDSQVSGMIVIDSWWADRQLAHRTEFSLMAPFPPWKPRLVVSSANVVAIVVFQYAKSPLRHYGHIRFSCPTHGQ